MGSVIEAIKAKLDIVEEIALSVNLKKSGRSYKGACPFHSERTPSFYVFPESQTWRCFGCNKGGDIFTFAQEAQSFDFLEALVYLSEKSGIPLENHLSGDPERAKENYAARAKLAELNETVALWFHQMLLHTREASGARAYIEERGISSETVMTFTLGYAPDRRDELTRYLLKQGYLQQDLIDAGLTRMRDEEHNPGGGSLIFDYFRNRLIFPIRDARGKIIGFGGRGLGTSRPKYLNSPQTILFEKTNVLYGIDQAREAMKQEGQAIIVEGYVDALIAHQYGTRQTVACIGSAITEQHVLQLKKLTKQLTLALDPDAAGDNATEQGIAVALKSADRMLVPIPLSAGRREQGKGKFRQSEPMGMIRFEEQVDLEINVLQLPQGVDPDEFIQRDYDSWAYAVKHPVALVDYYFIAKSADLDVRDPMGKAEAVRRLFPVIAMIRDRVKQDAYLRKLAALIKMDERHLFEEYQRMQRGQPAQGVVADFGERSGEWSRDKEGGRVSWGGGGGGERKNPQEQGTKLDKGVWSSVQWEDYLIGLLIRNPGLSHHICGIINDGDFTGTDTRELYRILNSKEQRESSPSQNSIENLVSPTLKEAVMRAEKCVVESIIPKDGTGLVREAVQCATRLKIAHLRQLNTELQYLIQEADQSGDKALERQFRQQLFENTQQLRTINTAVRLHV